MQHSHIYRLFVEKKQPYDVEAQGLFHDLKTNLALAGLKGVRVLNRYDISGLPRPALEKALSVFVEAPVDQVYWEDFPNEAGEAVFAIEYLPGQFDQRADSAAQCLQIIEQGELPLVHSAKTIVLRGALSAEELAAVKAYCINPVDSREAALEKPQSLALETNIPADVAILDGFIHMDAAARKAMHQTYGLAMSLADLEFVQAYFRDTEKRDPTITELRVIDTYWSDHCRHTTFHTKIKDVRFDAGHFNVPVQKSYQKYLASRDFVYQSKPGKPLCLMDMATLAAKELRMRGLLDDLDASEEINACSIKINVDVNGVSEPWLLLFKNETHNHPTEIEPFGGAATCLGGAIRDPLSGRAYVYQAMRLTGSGDPRQPLDKTLPGKLPQRKITREAARGYSSYGNQIGLATGQVAEVYDEDFIAKRMEIGAVIGAAPAENVRRQTPVPGDLVLLIGGRTGRDGCGGATGSSKEHDEQSLANCGAEVQKGNAPTERKLQRLFRHPEASVRIKRCNDFGAGGVSVAIGELADSLQINLDAVPKKYEGLDGTEIAISESQERMAVVIAPEDFETFKRLADAENLETTQVATVTDSGRLIMHWRGKPIVSLSREFLNTNGVQSEIEVALACPKESENFFLQDKPYAKEKADIEQAFLANLGELHSASQKGLVEQFDSTVGAGTVLLPFGGKTQQTPALGMAAKLPVLEGETHTASLMAYGYNPKIAKWSPYHGALYAVVDAVAKIVAMGGNPQGIRLSLQEYFEKLNQEPYRWGKPFAALLGAFEAQMELAVPAIGGKDSMSGSFKDMHVPPTLAAFAVTTVADWRRILSPEFKQAGSHVLMIPLTCDIYEVPDFATLRESYQCIHGLIEKGHVLAAQTIGEGGIAAAVAKMCFGNEVGMVFEGEWENEVLFAPEIGSIILELDGELEFEEIIELMGDVYYQYLGNTAKQKAILINGKAISLEACLAAWQKPLEAVFPTRVAAPTKEAPACLYGAGQPAFAATKFAKPRVLIPVFPGTNCEYDTARAFEDAGGIAEIVVLRNLSAADIKDSVEKLAAQIEQSQIIAFPGGFSAGDEPDGSGKFIAAVFKNPLLREAITRHLEYKDGLMLGICNGFQALVKLGLLPYGRIQDLQADSPTLTYNAIGRHVSQIVQTKVVSNLSPWFSACELGAVYSIAVSHGEGRFIATEKDLQRLREAGQIATQYVDADGNPTMAMPDNPNGSIWAIEGITSPDGRILGKMAHSERMRDGVAQNIPGNKFQPIFQGGIHYFK